MAPGTCKILFMAENSSGAMPKYWLEIIAHTLMLPDDAIAQHLTYRKQDLGTV
jgi:hypothetical protein